MHPFLPGWNDGHGEVERVVCFLPLVSSLIFGYTSPLQLPSLNTSSEYTLPHPEIGVEADSQPRLSLQLKMVFGSKRNSTTGNPHPNKITIQDNTNTATMKKSPFFASPSPEPVVEQQKLGFFGRKNSLARKGDQNIDSSSSSEKRGLLGGRKSVDSPERRTSGGGGGFFNFSK